MNKSTLGSEWVKNPDGSEGYTWNPISGCLNGCDYCYARKLANGRLKFKYLANTNFPLNADAHNPPYLNPFHPRLWENKLTNDKNNPVSRKKPIGIFTCNMSDLFGIGVPEEWTRRVLEHIVASPQHRFYLLTKQPQNLQKFSPFPDNCWVGQTLTCQADADRTFNEFVKVEATVKYVSLEPLLGKIDIVPYLKGWVNAGTTFENPEGVERYDIDGALVNHIDWVIIGAQTKPTVYPKIEWVQEIVEACDKAGIPVFLKDNLRDLLVPAALMNDIFWESDKAKLRQEMPNA